MLKKLVKMLFVKEVEDTTTDVFSVPSWSFEHNGWEQSAKEWERSHYLRLQEAQKQINTITEKVHI